MAKQYDFSRLRQKYQAGFVFYPATQGQFQDGKYVRQTGLGIPMRGVVVPLPEQRVYQSGGSLTTQDRQLMLEAPLPGWNGGGVAYRGNRYSVERQDDYTEYADLVVYLLKWVSLFSPGSLKG